RCVIASEIFSAAVFAFSHRYLGFFAVLNGAAGYCIFRICLKKTGSLVPGCIAHFLYNLLNLMLLSAF
ncbi:CPBP family glutamic-type intramembrane protease, partial [uncultured Treponema sp.]